MPWSATLPAGTVSSNASVRLPGRRPASMSKSIAWSSGTLIRFGTVTLSGGTAMTTLTVPPSSIVLPSGGSWDRIWFSGTSSRSSEPSALTSKPRSSPIPTASSRLSPTRLGTGTCWTGGAPPVTSRNTRKPTTARMASASRAEIQTHGLVPAGWSSS
jgi:hypothetical protein